MHRPNTDRVTHTKRNKNTVYTASIGSLFLTGVVGALFIQASSAGAFFSTLFAANTAQEQAPTISEEVLYSQDMTWLQPARNVDPNPSRGGGEVRTYGGVALVSEVNPVPSSSQEKERPAAPDQISLYQIQEGDTLSQVAAMFSVSVNTIVWANELRSTTDIRPGDTLLILPISGVQHTVKKGDTVASIAKRYEGDADEILVYNGLEKGESLAVGSVVTVPGGRVEEVKKPTPARSAGSRVAGGGSNTSGYYIHPLPGSVRTQGLHGYNAIDFGAPIGTPIRAAAAGRVIVSRVGGWNGGYGNYVVIDHPNGTQTLYAHNNSNIVWQGQSVVAGQVIGYVGNTGRSTGPHLHFEVRGTANPF
jgi:LysM repeat protein